MTSQPEELAGVRATLEALKHECRTIGQAPPRPGTLRATVGGIFVSVMQRLMFWYAPPVQRSIAGLIGAVEESVRILGTRLQQETERSAMLEQRLHQVHAQLDEQAQALRRQLDEQTRALEQERATTIDIENNVREQIDIFQQFQEEFEAWRGRLSDMETQRRGETHEEA